MFVAVKRSPARRKPVVPVRTATIHRIRSSPKSLKLASSQQCVLLDVGEPPTTGQ